MFAFPLKTRSPNTFISWRSCRGGHQVRPVPPSPEPPSSPSLAGHRVCRAWSGGRGWKTFKGRLFVCQTFLWSVRTGFFRISFCCWCCYCAPHKSLNVQLCLRDARRYSPHTHTHNFVIPLFLVAIKRPHLAEAVLGRQAGMKVCMGTGHLAIQPERVLLIALCIWYCQYHYQEDSKLICN